MYVLPIFLFIYPVGIQIFVYTPPMHPHHLRLLSKDSFLYIKDAKESLLTGDRVVNSAQPPFYLYRYPCLDVKKVHPATESTQSSTGRFVTYLFWRQRLHRINTPPLEILVLTSTHLTIILGTGPESLNPLPQFILSHLRLPWLFRRSRIPFGHLLSMWRRGCGTQPRLLNELFFEWRCCVAA